MRSNWFLDDDISGSSLRKPIVVLASSSANRLALLEQVGIYPLVEPSDYEENLSKSMPVDAYVTETAVHKAKEVARRFVDSETTFDVIIGCDTVITIDGLIIGKPRDKDDAYETLKRLSGREHSVFSGVAIIDNKENVEKFHEETVVEFGDIPDSVFRNYVNTGEPMGAAGSYRIQGKGATFVKQIRGNYPNVVGLPIFELVKRLRLILRK